MSLCVTGAGKVVGLALSTFTLAWTHSVERIDWEEDWRVTPAGLEIVEARVRGTGAGMEPPPEAKLDSGWWRWRPGGGSKAVVVLRRSGATADWRVCPRDVDGVAVDRACRLLGDIVAADPVALAPCPEGADPGSLTR